MKLHILSDIHNEFLRGGRFDPAHLWTGVIPQTAADVIILAGDIDTGTNGMEWMLAESARLEKPVIYVLGNHEFYRHEYFGLKGQLSALCKDSSVHLLDCHEWILEDIRFLGLTLWTDYLVNPAIPRDQAMVNAGGSLTDHRLIRFGDGENDRMFKPEDALSLHRKERKWLEGKLDETFTGKTVVITHHAPHTVCDHPEYPDSPIGPAFYSNMDALIAAHDIALWVFGHTHTNVNTKVDGTHILSNQAGYPGENVRNFDPDLVVEI